MAESWLIFVDTNILLDFYRLRGSSASKQLRVLEQNIEKLIVTEQVEMEFEKHRQRVLLDAISELKKPAEQKLPPFLHASQPALSMKKSIDEAVRQHRKVQEKVEKMLSSPSRNDDVYKSLQKLFRYAGPYVLARETPIKSRIRSLARKRFSLGYPPRKNGDSSMGDGLNWEWIINCAKSCPDRSNVVIVSRDGDYGVKRGNGHIVNDWLQKEFKERVGSKRKVELTELLTHAFKKISVDMSKEDVKEEQNLAASSDARPNNTKSLISDIGHVNRLANPKLFDPNSQLAAILERIEKNTLRGRIREINRLLDTLAPPGSVSED